MTYTETQLEAIRIFGRKDLTEGCVVKAEIFGRDEFFHCIGMRRITEGVGIYQYDKFEQDGVPIEILGHIPHLSPDLFRVADEKEKGFVLNHESLFIFGVEIPFIAYLPLLDQPNLSDILNLFK